MQCYIHLLYFKIYYKYKAIILKFQHETFGKLWLLVSSSPAPRISSKAFAKLNRHIVWGYIFMCNETQLHNILWQIEICTKNCPDIPILWERENLNFKIVTGPAAHSQLAQLLHPITRCLISRKQARQQNNRFKYKLLI